MPPDIQFKVAEIIGIVCRYGVPGADLCDASALGIKLMKKKKPSLLENDVTASII